MLPANLISFITPQGLELKGLWFGPKTPSTVFIVLHGLGASAFSSSNHNLFVPLANKDTAVVLFNNRGHDTVTSVKKEDKRRKNGFSSIQAGAAHEVFTDAADDIAGTLNFVAQKNPKQIFLIGHSTGCQKSVYYQFKKKDSRITGLILLSPVSDYAAIKHETSPQDLLNLQKVATALVQQGNPHTLLPQTIWPDLADAQRFLSLATPDSAEEVFPYSHDREPIELESIKVPILVILAEKDEYRDRSIKKISEWFDKTIRAPHEIKIIPDANHSFTEHAGEIIKTISMWVTAP